MTLALRNPFRIDVAVSDLSLKQSASPVFCQDWFIDFENKKVLGSHIAQHKVQVIDSHQVVTGELIYSVRKDRLGMQQGLNPVEVHIYEPQINLNYLSQKAQDKAAFHHLKRKTMRQLLAKLPRNVSFYFILPDGSDLVDLYQEQGFRFQEHLTYQKFFEKDVDVKKTFCRTTRQDINRAEKVLTVDTCSVEEFTDFYVENLAARDRQPHNPIAVMAAKLNVLANRGRLCLMAMRNPETKALEAALATTWDDKYYYCYKITHTLNSHAGACKLSFYTAMQDAQRRGLVFDMDGISDTHGGGHHFCLKRLKLEPVVRPAMVRPTFLEKIKSGLRFVILKMYPQLPDFLGRLILPNYDN